MSAEKEKEEEVGHHPFCNFWNGPAKDCKQCKGLREQFGDMPPDEIIEKHFPEVIKREGT